MEKWGKKEEFIECLKKRKGGGKIMERGEVLVRYFV